jgi:hypothetical protein
MPVVPVSDRGGAYIIRSLSGDDARCVRDKALEYLAASSERPDPVLPTTSVETLLTAFEGREMSPNELALAKEQLAFDDFPRAVDWEQVPPKETLQSLSVMASCPSRRGLSCWARPVLGFFIG